MSTTGIAAALAVGVAGVGGFLWWRSRQAEAAKDSSICADVQALGRLVQFDIPPSACGIIDNLGSIVAGVKDALTIEQKSWSQMRTEAAAKCPEGTVLVADHTSSSQTTLEETSGVGHWECRRMDLSPPPPPIPAETHTQETGTVTPGTTSTIINGVKYVFVNGHWERA